jgi:phospholipase C
MNRNGLGLLFLGALAASGCEGAGGRSPASVPDVPAVAPSSPEPGKRTIEHVVIVIQENRSFDNLFAKYPGADGATKACCTTAGCSG